MAHSHGQRLAGGNAAGKTGLSSTISSFSNSSPIAPPVRADSASTISHWPTISLQLRAARAEGFEDRHQIVTAAAVVPHRHGNRRNGKQQS